jgi:hypothetical protein
MLYDFFSRARSCCRYAVGQQCCARSNLQTIREKWSLFTRHLGSPPRGNDEYGVHRVTRLVRQYAARHPARLIAACLDDMRAFADASPPLDDLTLLAIQRMS